MEPSLAGLVPGIGQQLIDVDRPVPPVPFLDLVVLRPFAAQPNQHLAVAVDGRRKCLDVLDH